MPTPLNINGRTLNGVTTISVPDMVGNLTAGSTLVAALGLELSSASGISVSDTHNGMWNIDANSGPLSGSGGTNGAGLIVFARVPNTRSGTSGTITASWTGSCSASLSLYELPGSCVLDVTGTALTGSGSLTSLGFTIGPRYSGEFIVCVGLAYNGSAMTPDSGYAFPTGDQGVTWPDALNNDWHGHEYISSTSGTQSLNFGSTGTGGASIFAAAYGALPIITTQPQSQTVALGASATFSETDSGGTSWQWYVASPLTSYPPVSPGLYYGANSWAPIAGATSNSYTTAPITPNLTGSWYYCAVTNSFGTINTAPVRVWITGLGPDARGLQ